MGSPDSAGQKYAWEPRRIVRQRVSLLASAGLTSIAIAIGVARPEPVTFVIVLAWVALMAMAVIRTIRTAVGVTVRPDGIEVRTVIGPPRFAAWPELGAAGTRATDAGRELRITRTSGAPFAVITDRMLSFDELVQAVGARLSIGASEPTARRLDAPLGVMPRTRPTWTMRTPLSIADALARTRSALESQGYRLEVGGEQLRARSGLIALEFEFARVADGSVVAIGLGSAALVRAMTAVSAGLALVALAALVLTGSTFPLLPVGTILLAGPLVGAFLWQRAAADRARQAVRAIERALIRP